MRTLVLDDDEIHLAVVEGCLTALGSSHISTTTDPVEALEILFNEPIELVVVDLNMPLQDGLEILGKLSESQFSGAVIIISSEKSSVVSSAGHIGKKLGLNICGALSKPIDMKALTSAYNCAKVSVLPPNEAEPIVQLVPKGELNPFFYYQPQIDMVSGTIIGAEALLRGMDSEETIFGPHVVLNNYRSAEKSLDFAGQLFDLFCRDVRALRKAGFTNRFSFNVDATNFESPNFFEMLTKTIRKYELDAAGMVIELTKSHLPQNEVQLLATIARLTMAGFEIALDDFSTGASSFDLLRAGAFAELKLDTNLVQSSAEDASSAKFIASAVEIAKNLDVRLIAEGVESQADADRMHNMGVDCVQGFLIARPADKNQLQKIYSSPVGENRAAS